MYINCLLIDIFANFCLLWSELIKGTQKGKQYIGKPLILLVNSY